MSEPAKPYPELPQELRARLQRIMDARPDTSPLCHPHWAKQFLGDELTVLTCACEPIYHACRDGILWDEQRIRHEEIDDPCAGDMDKIATEKLRERAEPVILSFDDKPHWLIGGRKRT